MDEIDGSIHPSIDWIPSDVLYLFFTLFFSSWRNSINIRKVCMYTKEIIPTYMYVLFFFFFSFLFFSSSLFQRKKKRKKREEES